MGRPSLAAERTRQILDAVERCVARTGLVRLTLDDVAREAGLKRSQLRHFVGNRDDLIRAAILHFSEAYWTSYADAVARVAPDERLDVVLNFLFEGAFVHEHPDEERVLDAIIAGTAGDPIARQALRDLYERFHRSAADELRRAFPEARPEDVVDVSYALMSLAESHATFVHLELDVARSERALRLARQWIATLKTS